MTAVARLLSLLVAFTCIYYSPALLLFLAAGSGAKAAAPAGFTVKAPHPKAAAAAAADAADDEDEYESDEDHDDADSGWETASEGDNDTAVTTAAAAAGNRNSASSRTNQRQQQVAADADEGSDEAVPAEEDWEKWDVCLSLFDNKRSSSMQENLEYMYKTFGFYLPDSEYLVNPEGLLRYLGAKLQYGKVRECCRCIGGCDSPATSGVTVVLSVEDHMLRYSYRYVCAVLHGHNSLDKPTP